ncbi:MAG: hypothetical protein E7168_04945 [Firmicutes bacterium]|nr:hypothetical protein [Bacillota bacterium]
MIFFKQNANNRDYLVISRIDLGILIVSDTYNLPTDLVSEINKMYFEIFTFEKEKKMGYISEMSIPKNSLLGSYLIENQGKDGIINSDLRVKYSKVVNAFNLAVYTNNPIQEEILPLFKGEVSGERDELVEKYGETVIDYILEQPNFLDYVLGINNQDKSYVVYEDGKYEIKSFGSKVKKLN